MSKSNFKRLFIASTGGSGAGYLLRLFHRLRNIQGHTDWAGTTHFGEVLRAEFEDVPKQINAETLSDFSSRLFGEAGEVKSENNHSANCHTWRSFNETEFSAPAASGSAPYDAMVVLPCSMKTMGAAASGIGGNLIERAADVALKERRKLILVVRETPYNLVHVENMQRLILAGAVILPASPGFYHRPAGIVDLYDFIVDRIFQQIGIDDRKIQPWGKGGPQGDPGDKDS